MAAFFIAGRPGVSAIRRLPEARGKSWRPQATTSPPSVPPACCAARLRLAADSPAGLAWLGLAWLGLAWLTDAAGIPPSAQNKRGAFAPLGGITSSLLTDSQRPCSHPLACRPGQESISVRSLPATSSHTTFDADRLKVGQEGGQPSRSRHKRQNAFIFNKLILFRSSFGRGISENAYAVCARYLTRLAVKVAIAPCRTQIMDCW